MVKLWPFKHGHVQFYGFLTIPLLYSSRSRNALYDSIVDILSFRMIPNMSYPSSFPAVLYPRKVSMHSFVRPRYGWPPNNDGDYFLINFRWSKWTWWFRRRRSEDWREHALHWLEFFLGNVDVEWIATIFRCGFLFHISDDPKHFLSFFYIREIVLLASIKIIKINF